MKPLLTLQDLEDRHPRELITLAADEMTGIRDDDRILAAMGDAGSEIRGILKARYSSEELDRIDTDSRATLRMYAIDITLYRLAISFARTSETLKERYDAAIKRLKDFASGKAGLSFESAAGSEKTEAGSPNEVIIDAPERRFTRQRMRGL